MWDDNNGRGGRAADAGVIAPDDFGTRHRGPLRPPAGVPLGAQLVCVVEDTEVIALQRGRQLVVRFVEFPGVQLWCNRANVSDLCAQLGNQLPTWPLQLVPLECVEVPNPATGGKVRKWYPVQALEWAAALDAWAALDHATRRARLVAAGATVGPAPVEPPPAPAHNAGGRAAADAPAGAPTRTRASGAAPAPIPDPGDPAARPARRAPAKRATAKRATGKRAGAKRSTGGARLSVAQKLGELAADPGGAQLGALAPGE